MSRGRHIPDAREQFRSPGDEGVVEKDCYALARLDEVEHSFITVIAAGPEQQPLEADLDPFRLPGAFREVGGLAALVVHRGDGVAMTFNQVYAGDGAQGFVGHEDGACVDGLVNVIAVIAVGGGGSQYPRRAVHPAVPETALDGVHAVGELALHPFQVGQSRAVSVLVEHPGRNQVLGDVDGVFRFRAADGWRGFPRVIRHH